MNVCVYCGNPVDPRKQRFCSQCGAPLIRRGPFASFILQALQCAGYYATYIIIQFAVLSFYSIYVQSRMSGTITFTQEQYQELFYQVYATFFNQVFIFADFLVILLICIFLKLINKNWRAETNVHRMPVTSFVGILSFGFALQIFVTFTLGLIIAFFPASEPFINQPDETQEILKNAPFLWEFLLVAIVTPIFEEFFFRGILYTRLRKALPTAGAVILSAVIFGVAHGNLVQGIYAGCLGIVLALLYEKYNSLWASVALHAAFNAGSYLISFLASESDALFVGLWLISLGLIFVCIAVFFCSRPVYETPPRKVTL